MPNTKSAKKRVRQSEKRRHWRRYYIIGMRKEVKAFMKLTDPEEVKARLPKLYSIIDRLYRRGIFHRNKVARIKSRVAKHANAILAKQ